MSDLLGQQNSPTVTAPLPGEAELAGSNQSAIKPVTVWAAVGGALLALQLFVWGSWISGPYFHRVAAGPSDPPTFMKAIMVANAIMVWIIIPIVVWQFIIKPWRQERRFTLDGMLMVSCGLMFFQDPLLDYFNNWCTYNSWNFNMGAWTQNVPGWISPELPGHMTAEPILTNTPGYAVNIMFIILGCWIMRKIKARFPGVSNMKLIGAIFLINIVVDFVMEGLVLLPIGFYVYPGAIRSVSINAGTYYQWPIYEGILWGGVLTALCCLRYFTDDRGRTIAERGLDRVQGSFAKLQLVRFLAIFAAVSACFFLIYNVPVQWFAMHSDPWPDDVLKRSYFTGGLCGDGTDSPCPDPNLPMPTNGSGYVDFNGHLVLPNGAKLPTVVPNEGRK